MKTILSVYKRLPADAMAIWPLILLKQAAFSGNKTLLNHERIHLRQQAELLVLPFYIWYMAEYLWHRLKGKDHNGAYLSIRFEREAYSMQGDYDYLGRRSFWAFMRF